MQCEMMMELLTAHAERTLDGDTRRGVEAHMSSCADCRAEFKIIQALVDSEPMAVPVDLEARVLAAAREALEGREAGREVATGSDIVALKPRWTAPSWAMGAAAVLVLALGTPLLMNQMSDSSGEGTETLLMDDPIATVWTTDDGLIAGAPALDMLTDEELSLLLAELGG